MPHTPTDDDLLLNQIARQLSQRGLRQPALLAVEAGRPLIPLLGQLLYVAQPALSLLWPSERIGQTARLLESPGAGQRLLACLDPEENDGTQ